MALGGLSRNRSVFGFVDGVLTSEGNSDSSASLAWPPMLLSLREAFCFVKASISFFQALESI
jgi:hypothetical protein